MHKAKGLEFNRVIVPDAADGVYPFFFSKTEEDEREDARKLYVALSRAKERISVYYSRMRVGGWGRIYSQSMSPFLKSVAKHFE